MVSGSDVLRYLSSLDYPAGKDDVIREAKRRGAPDEVLRALRALPPVDYANGNEVVRSAATDIAEGQSAADRAARTRDKRHQHVAQHLRGL